MGLLLFPCLLFKHQMNLFLASNIRTPDRHDGSVIGFSDSNSSQKLLLYQHQYPHQQHHHHNVAQPLNEQHSSNSLVPSGGEQYHQIHDDVTNQQYVVRSPNRSPSSPIIPVKSSISKHSRIGEYQGIFIYSYQNIQTILG